MYTYERDCTIDVSYAWTHDRLNCGLVVHVASVPLHTSIIIIIDWSVLFFTVQRRRMQANNAPHHGHTWPKTGTIMCTAHG